MDGWTDDSEKSTADISFFAHHLHRKDWRFPYGGRDIIGFEVRRRKSCRVYNPKTSGAVKVPAKCVISFESGKVMEAKVVASLKAKKEKADGVKGT